MHPPPRAVKPADEEPVPLPAGLIPQATTAAELPPLPNGRPLIPAPNWWPISPGFRDREDESAPPSWGEVKVIVGKLALRIAALERQASGRAR
jgi:hypothetical protein